MSVDDLTGRTLGRVRLQEILGEGGAGVVYRGRHTTLDKPVAVKVLKSGQSSSDKRYAERFRREARLAASIEDPSIVRVLDYGEEEGCFYLVMDYIDGYPLGRYLRNRRGPVDEFTGVKIILAVAHALGVAHRAGIVHRDLKPDNLLLSRKGSLHLADLGLAKGEGMGDLTQERYVVGSPAYMAPESFTPGLEVDHRCDLYALGVIGYHLLYGELPYQGEVDQILQGHRAGTADFSRPTHCSKRLVGVVRRLMAVNREDRFQSAQELVDELRPHFAMLKKKLGGWMAAAVPVAAAAPRPIAVAVTNSPASCASSKTAWAAIPPRIAVVR